MAQITGDFSTRREAELAVERLVQEHGLDRKAVTVTARGQDNSAGTRAAGADAESGHPGVEKHGEPDLNGAIQVSVGCDGADDADTIRAAMREAGAQSIGQN